MAATMTPAHGSAVNEWSNDWNVVSNQNTLSWGTWEAPAPAPIAKTPFVKVTTPIQPPAPLPSASFVPIASNTDTWSPIATPGPSKAPLLVPVVQSPPSISPSSFVDVSLNASWDLAPALPAAPEPVQVPPLPVLSSPQRSIKLRQGKEAVNIESELRHQDLYKTEYCRSWRETGICRYGNKCQFAHGENELRPVLRHPKYKTEVCRNFSETGACPYGTRCRFVHYQRSSRSSSVSSQGTDLASEETQTQTPSEQEQQEALALQLASLSLAVSAPVPVAVEEPKEKPKGSRLPFFQKLRRNTSSEKEKESRK